MSLLNNLRRLDDEQEVFDDDTNCDLTRNAEGDLTFTRSAGHYFASATLKELLEGPCRGLRGAHLVQAVRSEMQRRLDGAAEPDDASAPAAVGSTEEGEG